ncbi:glutamine--fructose-6-phosphate transaminase (isomerizing) [Pseudobacteriovorax antillogorgiicola]|uniref:Glutamine--fructose-6-phosphate aminotransferase [isomerizing] n=1 Tax=Pseudobacteriovorax antillogorgiicola TaxID=1513793 RepID=A0A1Y6CPU1_9BACT|nr:glutamine--fructose-6-phosphate transaminase (isomerizing) [Pseudobacteriovorax antillogorgiicola]TCS46692.1 glutamine--fructose-6-phosphate transaminase [Pseudobacteriovorax antillogorgiicola]SMF66784.1 glutamine--fructose-6-phosphate transaminase [Pseudobacteriovorax antillogorgiicola]
MCGIVGYVGPRNAVQLVFDGLKKLEYRGYDSAGIAAIKNGQVYLEKEKGKLVNLGAKLDQLPSESQLAVGHTRWATHGGPSQVNAHPHQSEGVTIVHNGIIENYDTLKSELKAQGVEFNSDTDTEVIAHVLSQEYAKDSSPQKALLRGIARLNGAYALGVLFSGQADTIFLAKEGSPLVIGVGQDENYFGSDITTFAEVAKQAIFLNDGECASISAKEVRLWDFSGAELKHHYTSINWTPGSAEKHGYRHYMLKEIHEQPSVISHSIEHFLKDGKLNEEALGITKLDLDKIQDINIVACGTAFIAGLLGKYFIEPLTGLPVNVDLASEFRYRNPHMLDEGRTLVIAVSQSGETADTLASLKHAKEAGCQIFSVCNVEYSSIDRISDSTLLMNAGPEIGVASTKAFTSQILCLYLWANAFAKQIGKLSPEQENQMTQELHSLPVHIDLAMNSEDKVKTIINDYYESPNFLYIGRGPSYPIALEGALKLKEISYIHAEGYASGELKHGPIALVDRHMPIVAIAPQDEYHDKSISNIEEVRAREGMVIGIGHDKDDKLQAVCNDVIPCPQVNNPAFQAILSSIPIQFLAYHIAVKRGTDVDQPRNLAKSVTVE